VGPPRFWEYRYDAQFPRFGRFIYGASYVSLPQGSQLPPSAATAQWLDMQEIRALVWGGGQWFANGAGGSSHNRLDPRGIRSSDKGTAYMTAPTQWRYPDLIVVNGTDYTDNAGGDLVYRSESGAVLDLGQLGK